MLFCCLLFVAHWPPALCAVIPVWLTAIEEDAHASRALHVSYIAYRKAHHFFFAHLTLLSHSPPYPLNHAHARSATSQTGTRGL